MCSDESLRRFRDGVKSLLLVELLLGVFLIIVYSM